MNMVGIVFSNLFDENFGVLTKNRTVASLPFAGRYRFIDFVLSNMSNSNITDIGVITKSNYKSLMDHLGSCASWDLDRKNGGVYLLPPFAAGQTTVYQGKLEALYSAFSYLEKQDRDYVLLSDSTVILNIDYEAALEQHIKSGRDITVICDRVKADPPVGYTLVMEETDGEIRDMYVDYPALRDGALASLGMFIMERKKLISVIREAVSRGKKRLERDFIQQEWNSGRLSVGAYVFSGRVIRNTGISSYFHNNLSLISDSELRNDIFNPARPIYTKVRDEVPSYYGPSCETDECLIADGCRIEGAVSNSVLFRDVKIGSGAKIKNSIIMQGSVIGENCIIENAIIDKDVTVTASTHLQGAYNTPIIIEKGETV